MFYNSSQPRKLTFYCIFGSLFSDRAVVVNPKISRKKSIFWAKNQVFGKKFELFSKILSSLQPRGRKFIKNVTWTKIFAKIVIFVQKCHFLGQKRGNFPPNFRRLWRRKCVVVVNFFADFGD